MPGMFQYLVFRFKVAMAGNSKIATIKLRKTFLHIYIKQFPAINEWNYLYEGFLRNQKCFSFIIIDIRSKMAAKLKMAAISKTNAYWYKT